MSFHDAWDIWQQGFRYVDEQERPAEPVKDAQVAFLHYVREKIHLLKRRQASGKVENSTGFLLQAIRQNYANPEFAQEQKREALAATHQAKREWEKQVKALEQHKAHLANARDQALDQLRDQVAAEAPGVLDQAAAELMDNNGFRFVYDRSKSALENYQARAAIQPFFYPYLERHALARFEAVQQHYTAQIATVDGQLAALSPGGA